MNTFRLRMNRVFAREQLNTVTRTIVVLAGCLMLIGSNCSESVPLHRTSPHAPIGYYRDGDQMLSPQDARAIANAAAYLKSNTAGGSVDAFYMPKQTKEGFLVHVIYVHGYTDVGKPIYIPGEHCTLVLSEELKVIDVKAGM